MGTVFELVLSRIDLVFLTRLVHTEEPDVLMFGMLTALVSASFMMAVANFYALPISTTHTIIGSIVGFSIAAKGFESVVWETVGLIFVSWAAAPLITGVFGALFFWTIRRFVLLSEEPYKRSVAIYPLTIFLAVGLDIFMVLYKAGKNNKQIKTWGLKFQLPVAFGISAILAGAFYFFLEPVLTRRISAKFDGEKVDDVQLIQVNEEKGIQDGIEEGIEKAVPATEKPEQAINKTERTNIEDAEGSDGDAQQPSTKSSLFSKTSKIMQSFADKTINRDIEAEAFAQSDTAQEMWESGEDFDPKTEQMFSYLQVSRL